MAVIQMTDEEKALLDLAYTDGERIAEGKLFDYQEKALAELRSCMFYLKKRYPNEDLKVISFQPSTSKGCTQVQFVQPGLESTEYLLKYENGEYIDNFYDVPFQREYDELVEAILKDAGINARVYTTFPFLIADEIHSGRDLMDHRPHLGRTMRLFFHADVLPSYEEAEAMAKKVAQLFEEKGVYGSGIIFYVLGMNDLEKENILELEAYARNRKNVSKVVSAGFRCFNVKEETVKD
ncbi:MAG: hypothetical protein II743_10345 [Lachnospiraceae bacterium]|nr:hypothetical protein [Lachnospiraceae bacterium]